ncbi:MAG: zf-HC2 domain-containing protein [Gemmatimonadaceae bacterium]|nr:zf-HC2 domain-containing protein [Gemmatimonadaceae bacterium]
MQHPDEGMIHSWLDGELSPEEASHIEMHIAECAQCAGVVAEARGLVAASSRILIALDDVPGNVIPISAPRKRAWYSRNDMRAAAALLLVASASLLVVRNREGSLPRVEMARAVSEPESAPSPVAGSARATDMDATGATAGAAAKERATGVPSEPAALRSREDMPPRRSIEPVRQEFSGRASGTAAKIVAKVAAAPEGVQAISETQGAEADVRKREEGANSVTTLSDTLRRVVTGRNVQAVTIAPPALRRPEALMLEDVVASRAAASEGAGGGGGTPLKEIRADSVGSVHRTVYAVSPGIEVTLGESGPTGLRARNLAARASEAGGAMQRAGSAPSAASAPSATKKAATPPAAPLAAGTVMQQMKTISWTDSVTGRHYTLTGPLSARELEKLKARIIRQRR